MHRDDILAMKRSQVRYHLFRIRTEVQTNGARPHEAPELKAFYEAQEGFADWLNFAERWDIGPEGQHDTIIKRAIGEQAEWRARLENLIPESQVKVERVEGDPWPPTS